MQEAPDQLELVAGELYGKVTRTADQVSCLCYSVFFFLKLFFQRFVVVYIEYLFLNSDCNVERIRL